MGQLYGFLDILAGGDFLYLLRGSYPKFQLLPRTVTSCGFKPPTYLPSKPYLHAKPSLSYEASTAPEGPLIWYPITLIKASPIRACSPGEHYRTMSWDLCCAAEMDDRNLSCARG
ncbi:hypothetical protein ARMSODRAFT_438951 [Armillaria solidipes]|uniref:Uncharacterized protein n=1 Tax=Armillaria solidipes TaxID=1076256 RepID=A0A2H3BL13_9AGAR|nr:hypothetical protein ARMSODRAFT_438951 [Armillaria solidipes]